MSDGVQKYYRYRADHVVGASFDENGSVSRGFAQVEIYLDELYVVKTTPKGVWVSPWRSGHWNKRFILNTSRRKYAWPTKEEAFVSLKARLDRQASILSDQMARNRERRDAVKRFEEMESAETEGEKQ